MAELTRHEPSCARQVAHVVWCNAYQLSCLARRDPFLQDQLVKPCVVAHVDGGTTGCLLGLFGIMREAIDLPRSGAAFGDDDATIL